MTTPLSHSQASPLRQPLPITIVPGMPVYDVFDIPAGEIIAITQAYCIYRVLASDSFCVANWRDVAIGNVCPADPLLPADIAENDKRNAAATALRELLALQQLATLSPAQSTALDELTRLLCQS